MPHARYVSCSAQSQQLRRRQGRHHSRSRSFSRRRYRLRSLHREPEKKCWFIVQASWLDTPAMGVSQLNIPSAILTGGRRSRSETMPRADVVPRTRARPSQSCTAQSKLSQHRPPQGSTSQPTSGQVWRDQARPQQQQPHPSACIAGANLAGWVVLYRNMFLIYTYTMFYMVYTFVKYGIYI